MQPSLDRTTLSGLPNSCFIIVLSYFRKNQRVPINISKQVIRQLVKKSRRGQLHSLPRTKLTAIHSLKKIALKFYTLVTTSVTKIEHWVVSHVVCIFSFNCVCTLCLYHVAFPTFASTFWMPLIYSLSPNDSRNQARRQQIIN